MIHSQPQTCELEIQSTVGMDFLWPYCIQKFIQNQKAEDGFMAES